MVFLQKQKLKKHCPHITQINNIMTKFGSAFMMKSPIKKHGEEFRRKAKQLSKKSGTPGDYDRDNPKVVEQLEKAKKAEAEHEGSPAKMNSPLHAPVTATQPLTSDIYYQPREQVDYQNMVESFGELGKAGKSFFGGEKKTKVETDPVEDLYNKVQAQTQAEIDKKQKDLQQQNTRTKTIQETTTMKWIPNSEGSTQGSFQRVDSKGNIYIPESGKEYKKIFDPQAVVKSIMR